MRNSLKLEIDKSKIMVWVKKDLISGNTFIGIEFPKTIPVQRRIQLAYEIGSTDRSFQVPRSDVYFQLPMITRFTRIFKGELVKLIEPDLDEYKIRGAYMEWLMEYFNIKF